MGADDLLAGRLDGIDVAHLAAEHRAATAELRRLRAALTVDQQIRSTALLAAATWLASETFTHPERRELLTVASALAGWIRDGSPVDPNPRPRPTSTPRQEATPT